MFADTAEEVARLRDDVDRAAQQYEAAQKKIGPVRGSDRTGAVTVAVDAAGLLQDVRVDGSWRRSLDSSLLAAAVQEAVLAAAVQRSEDWATSFAQQSEGPQPGVRPMPTPDESLAGQLSALSSGSSSASSTAALEELLLMLKAINDGIDDVSTQIIAELSTPYVGRSGAGHVTATVSGSGAIQELTYDPRWLKMAHHTNLGRETLEAVRAAHLKMAGRTLQDIVDSSALGEMQALARDPRAMAERLHLIN